jgi:hypothetical protein
MFATFDPANDEDGLPISVRGPKQSWRANLFWGLLGLPMVVMPPWFGEKPLTLDDYGAMLIGAGWMALMGASAWRNFGRRVQCDTESITLSQPFDKPLRVALPDVASVTREDVRKKLLEVEESGMPQDRRGKGLDTRAPIVMVVLRDAQGRTLMRLDKDMEPAGEMQRLLRRLERQAGPVREG